MILVKLIIILFFGESGQIYDDYPKAKGRKIIIDIVLAQPFNQEGETFFKEAKKIIRGSELDIELQSRVSS